MPIQLRVETPIYKIYADLSLVEGRKILSLHSSIKIRNHTTVPMAICGQLLMPQSQMYVPLAMEMEAATSSFRIRALEESKSHSADHATSAQDDEKHCSGDGGAIQDATSILSRYDCTAYEETRDIALVQRRDQSQVVKCPPSAGKKKLPMHLVVRLEADETDVSMSCFHIHDSVHLTNLLAVPLQCLVRYSPPSLNHLSFQN